MSSNNNEMIVNFGEFYFLYPWTLLCTLLSSSHLILMITLLITDYSLYFTHKEIEV